MRGSYSSPILTPLGPLSHLLQVVRGRKASLPSPYYHMVHEWGYQLSHCQLRACLLMPLHQGQLHCTAQMRSRAHSPRYCSW